MILRLTVAAFLAALMNTALADPSQKEAWQLCTDAFSEVRASVFSAPNVSASTRKTVRLITDERICQCTEQRLREKGPTTVANTEEDGTRFLRANSACFAEHVTSEFPRQCPEVYAELLPRLGYQNPTSATLEETCSCVNRVMTRALAGDAVFMHKWLSAKYEAARSFDTRYGTHTADQIQVPGDPLAKAFEEAKHCLPVAGASGPK